MLDRTAAQTSDRDAAAAAATRPARRGRRRALAVCAALAVAFHLVFLDGVGGWALVPSRSSTTPVSVRTIVAEPAGESAPRWIAETVFAQPPAQLEPRPGRRPPDLRRVAGSAPRPAASATEASARSVQSRVTAKVDAAQSPTRQTRDAGYGVGSASGTASAVEAAAPAAVGAREATSAVAGDPPPPVYRTRLPPPATLHYQVRRGFLRGDGEIRWQPAGDAYRLVLESRISGLTLLLQTSEGAIDANGLAPVRFVDHRARRPAQAANFVRDAGRITFSGSGAEWPLFAGSQDRLSWMIQLAGIAAAEPQLLVEGGEITLAVVGARGDAGLWVLRVVGREDVETAAGAVRAVKLVRQGRSAYDTTAEIWLDPERSYLPARATLRNNAGVSEYDLLLERVDAGP